MLSIKIISAYASYLLIGVLAIPSFLIVITWSALPGSQLYPIKRGLEKVALKLASADFITKSALRSKLIDRRYQESSQLLAKSSSQGLGEFNQEVQSATQDLVLAGQTARNTQFQQELKNLINQLEIYNQEFEAKKQVIATAPAATPVPTAQSVKPPNAQKPLLKPISSPTIINPASPTPPQVINHQVVIQVSQTQEQLNQALEELRQLQQRQQEMQQQMQSQNQPSPSPDPEDQQVDEPPAPEPEPDQPQMQGAPPEPTNEPLPTPPTDQNPPEKKKDMKIED